MSAPGDDGPGSLIDHGVGEDAAEATGLGVAEDDRAGAAAPLGGLFECGGEVVFGLSTTLSRHVGECTRGWWRIG